MTVTVCNWDGWSINVILKGFSTTVINPYLAKKRGKISVQPHTLIVHVCAFGSFFRSIVLAFVSVFRTVCITNNVWGFTEIFPKKALEKLQLLTF